MDFNAYYFGPTRQLFGSFHSARTPSPRGIGVLICPPLFHEYYKAHSALKRLANHLAETGYSVLRFDYRGCGDSFGRSRDCTIGDWIEDMEHATLELQQASSCTQLAIVAVRFAGSVAIASNIEFRRLVIWDPVLSGSAYSAALLRKHHETINEHPNLDAGHKDHIEQQELLGERYAATMLSDVRSMELEAEATDLIEKGQLSTVNTEADWLSVSANILLAQEPLKNVVASLQF